MSWTPPTIPQQPGAYARYDRRTGLFAIAQADVEPDPAGGPMGMRGFVRTWDVDAEGVTKGAPLNSWSRGELVRSGQPIFVLTSLGPVYDPSAPNTWRPGL